MTCCLANNRICMFVGRFERYGTSIEPVVRNIVEPILFQCKLNPLATAICAPGSSAGSINYGASEDLI
jgi:hypothetical protein